MKLNLPTTGLAIGVTVILTFPVSVVTGATSHKQPRDQSRSSMSHDEFTSAVKDALHHAQEANRAGEQGDAEALKKHAQTAITKAKEAQRAGHNERLNEGVYALGEAVEHAGKDHAVDATEHVKHAIMKLSQSAGLQIPEGVPTGEGGAKERIGG